MGPGLSVIASDTTFPEVASSMDVDGSICSAYLVAVLWKDTNYCSGYADFPGGVKCGNWLMSIEWYKLLKGAYQHRTWHAQLGPLEPVGLLGQYCGS